MSELVKKMTPSCSTYVADVCNLALKHYRGNVKKLSGKIGFLLVDPAYDVPMDSLDDHAKYNVFSSNDIKDKANILRDTVESEAHAHVVCSALKLFSVSKCFLPKRRKSKAV